MTKTELDWTFDHIPPADEPPPPPPQPGRPPRPSAARRAWRSRLPAAPLLGLALLVTAGLGAWLFTRIGLGRLRAQVQAEVAYEDGRSRLRDLEAVGGVQASEMTHWIAQRAAEAALGLPAPLPAGNLLPVDAPPRIVAFAARESNVFDATVLRGYADADGQVYQFEVVQRYRNTGPGRWERLPPDEAPLQSSTLWAGERLSVTLPLADQPFLGRALPRIDVALIQACLDWYCPPDLKLEVVFGPQLADLALPASIQRPAGHDPAGYPLIFDLPPLPVRYPAVHRLPSPHLAGYPHDARAAEALIRSLTGNLLAALASQAAQHARTPHDFFFDALVARAEARLGLSASNPALAAPYEYLPFETLWWLTFPSTYRDFGADRAAHAQALDLLDYALAGRPSTLDGQLLHRLDRSESLSGWLNSVLGSDADGIESRWWQERQAALPAPPARLDARLDGLALACGPDVLVAHDGALQTLTGVDGQRLMLPGPVSLDGGRLALFLLGRSDNIGLAVADLGDRSWRRVQADRPASLVGWSTAGHLLYMDVHPANSPASFQRLLRLEDYDPQSRVSRALLPEPVLLPWVERAAWSPQRDALALGVLPEAPAGDPRPQVWLVWPASGQVRRLGVSGYSPAFSPDASRLALVSGADPLADVLDPGWRLDVVDLLTQAVRTVAAPTPPPLLGQFVQVGGLQWSPDGRWLSYVAQSDSTGLSLFVVPSAGGAQPVLLQAGHAPLYPVGFSADSRYLAGISYGALGGLNEVVVFDLQAPASEGVLGPLAAYPAQSAAWSTSGRTLLVAGASGVYAFDPGARTYLRLTTRTCLSL